MKLTLETFNPQRPLGFIVFEGVNGSGKSTLLRSVTNWLSTQEKPTLATQEPGGTDFGLVLRKMLLESPSSERSPMAEALLFTADRAQHVEKAIHPALAERKFVLSDRYYYSTVAFQGYGHGLSIKSLLQLSTIATKNLIPDLVFLLDIDPQVGLTRNAEKNEIDSFEDHEIAFHNKIRNGFLKLAHSLPDPFVILDANLSQDELLKQALPYIEKLINAS